MARQLNVLLNKNDVGILSQTETGRLQFRYHDTWIANPDAIPLSRSLPLQSETYDQGECQAYFAGLLPDEGQRELIARSLGISSRNEFAMLKIIGGECAGAVTFHEQGARSSTAKQEFQELTDDDLLSIFSELNTRPLLAGRTGFRLSLAGAQSKIAVCVHDSAIALPLNGTPSTHILKPPSPILKGLVENEAFCMRLAAKCGLRVANVQVRRIGDIRYLLIERYDRRRTEDGIVRIHQEDFCQALGIPPWTKYEQEGGPGLAECFGLVRTTCTVPAVSLIALLDAVLFNWLIGNADAHGKNFSLLAHARDISFSPLYDLVSTRYFQHLDSRMSMKIGGEYEINRINLPHFERMAKQCSLSSPMVKKRVIEMTSRIRETIDSFEVEFENEVTQLLRKQIRDSLLH